MKRALAVVLLLAIGLQGCATAIIGGGGSSTKCDQRDARDCPK